MSNSMYQLMLDLRASTANLQQDMNKAVGILERSGSSISRISQGIFQGFGQALGQLSIQKISALSDAIGDLAAKGERAGSIADGFRKLGGTADVVQQASRSLKGMVSEFELMRLANENVIRGMPDINKNFALLAEYAGRFANSTGRDTVQVFEQISEAITEASGEQLQKFGLAIQTTGDKAKDMQAALELLPGRIQELIPITESVANAQTAFNIALEDAGSKIGIGINNSQQLAQTYRELSIEIAKIDWEDIGKSLASVASSFLNLATSILPSKESIANFARGLEFLIGKSKQAKADMLALEIGNLEREAKVGKRSRTGIAGMFEILSETPQQAQVRMNANELQREQARKDIQKKREELRRLTIEMNNVGAHLPTNPMEMGLEFKGGKWQPRSNPFASIGGDGGSGSKAADELKKAAESWQKVVDGLRDVDLKEAIQGSIQSVDEASFQKLRDQIFQNARDSFIKANAESARAAGKSQEELAARAQQYARQQVAAYDESMQDSMRREHEERVKMAEDVARQEAEARRTLMEHYGLDFSGSMLGGFSQVASQMADIVDSTGQLSAVFGQFAQQLDGLGRFIYDSATFLGNTMSTQQAHASGIQGPGMADGNFGPGGAELAGYASFAQTGLGILSSVMSASDRDKANKDNSGSGAAGGMVAGAIAGGVIGQIAIPIPVLGAAIGAAIGGALGNTVGGLVGGLFKWGSQDPDTQSRHQFANFMEEKFEEFGALLVFNSENRSPRRLANFIEGSRNRFNQPGWADSYNQNPNMGTFSGLGLAFNEMLDLPRDVGDQIGALLFDNLEGNVNNARMLMKKLGLSFQEVEEALMAIGMRGEKTWLEIEVGLQGASEAFKDGLVEVGNFQGAMQMLLDTGGRGFEALEFVRTIGIEAKEAGIKNFEELRLKLLETFDPETVDAFFAALEQRGIKNIEQLIAVDDRTAGGIVADMDAAGAAFKDTAATLEGATQEANSSIQDATRAIKELSAAVRGQKFVPEPEDEVDVEMASGGVLMGPKRALMGEAGPEAIIPLTRKNGKLGVAFHGSMGGGSGGNTIVINAQGAAPGVEHAIRSAIREAEERAVARVYRSMNYGRGRTI